MKGENAKRRRDKEFRRSLAEEFAVRTSVQRQTRREARDQKERKHQPRVNERRQHVGKTGAVRRNESAEIENMVPGEKDVINDDQNDRRAADKIQVMGARRKINVGKRLRFHWRCLGQRAANEKEDGETSERPFIVRETAALCNGTRKFREKTTARKEKRRTQTRKNEPRSTLYVMFR